MKLTDEIEDIRTLEEELGHDSNKVFGSRPPRPDDYIRYTIPFSIV